MRLKIGIVVLSLLLLIGCAGCSTVVLHPIDKSDIAVMSKGKAYTPEKDGYFLSDEYVKEVMDVKVER